MSSRERLPLLDPTDQSWRSRFISSASALSHAEQRGLEDRARLREGFRVAQGVYAEAEVDPRPEARLLRAVRAHHLRLPESTFSHRSSAALWRLPRIGDWPTRVEILVPVVEGGHATRGILHRRESVTAERTEIEGISTTSLSRTALDLARVDDIASAVASMDAAVRGIRMSDGHVERADPEAMRTLLELFPSKRGRAQARFVLDFADARAELPGESLSRLQIHRLGLTPPQLQVVRSDEEGEVEGDFFWPEFGVWGEFDGYGKYLLRDSDPTRSAVKALMSEKRREDRIRSFPDVRAFVRWDWSLALDRPRLGALLGKAGVR